MPHTSLGILKNGPKTHDKDHSSSESLLPAIHNAHFASSATITMPEPARKSFPKDEHEHAFIRIPIDDESDSENIHRPRQQQRVQFPESCKDSTYVQQDTDGMSNRSSGSSLYGDDDNSSDYDWSDEEDLVDEQAKFDKNLSNTEKKKGWGPRRLLAPV